MRIQGVLAATVLFVASLFSAAEAAPITYTLAAIVDGSIGSTTLSGTHFFWTLTGNTNSATVSGSPAELIVPALTDTLTISGIGNVAPTYPFMFVKQVGAPFAGFVDNHAQGIAFYNPTLTAYSGTTAFIPTLVSLADFVPVSTDHGDFIITDAELAFTAATPEPVTLALFGAGLAGIGALRRRKQKA